MDAPVFTASNDAVHLRGVLHRQYAGEKLHQIRLMRGLPQSELSRIKAEHEAIKREYTKPAIK